MGCRSKFVLDLNEPPAEDEDVNDVLICAQPQKSFPIPNPITASLFPPESRLPVQSSAFSHASFGSGFQPFVRLKDSQGSKVEPKDKEDEAKCSEAALAQAVVPDSLHGEGNQDERLASLGVIGSRSVEREEGEWSDMEIGDADGSACSHKKGLEVMENPQEENELGCANPSRNVGIDQENVSDDLRNHASLASEASRSSDASSKGLVTLDRNEEMAAKSKDVKGIEAIHALRVANNSGKRPKLDDHKEAMLGKKRARQTVFINMEDAKQAGPIKILTPRRQNSFPAPIITRTVKETTRSSSGSIERLFDRQSQIGSKDQKQSDASNISGTDLAAGSEQKAETNGDYNSGSQARSSKFGSNEHSSDAYPPQPISRVGSWKAPGDSRLLKNPIASSKQTVGDSKPANKKPVASKRQSSSNIQSQDTSVERLVREVTSGKFWHHPGETELQCVPGRFESLEEYVRVFEPLLFEECRAQLYSTWEELAETVSKDAHIMVRAKSVERRERGWYDIIVLPAHECKWNFKEGDVAVLSSPRPGAAARSNKRNQNGSTNEENGESENSGRVVGTVRRHIPTDTRDPLGAILHIYVGDTYDFNSKLEDDHILTKIQPKSTWYLTVLGSLATTQREYVALHAFRRLNLQMQTAILKPSPEHFPKYEDQPPAMPDCFTQKFTEHLHRTFNGPQLAAIQWAAMHTAAGTTNGSVKRQEPWPFTLVQGPPGTGKTHTVWGMLNVIHLVQYQHYYTALLKKLAPESYKQASEGISESIGSGSIDEVLQTMDQSLFRTLPKLCPKPRMLVCAPSNAATDELLSRVLDRGFIDGEMKVYRPDVARVGVDSQTRAAQAVSVERRTEQLLLKPREEVIGWMHQLKAREAQFSQQIAILQRELNVAAAAVRSQGSVGVDPDVLIARDHNRDHLLQNLAAAVEGRDKVLVEMSRMIILENRFRAGGNFNLEDARANLEASFANEAEIVFTTVSSSGRKLFSRLTHGFDMVVIDEAAQASEVAILPPLSLGAARCVLVGDPQQLPATVISKAAGVLLYSRSLFERFQQAGCPTMLLSVQYRMHPRIRDFPSRYFYQGRLTDSDSVVNLDDEIYYKDPVLQPYVFYDIMHGRESHSGGSVSFQNIHEAQFALRLYERLQKFVKSSGAKKVSVGIITPYKLQLKCLQREFEEVLGTEDGRDIYINTVDAFQGQERDVIIMSCVRASNHGVGFVADIRRMNVALTRARRALWVVGNANALMQSDDWAALIKDAKARNCFVEMDSIPNELLVLKGPSYGQGRFGSNNSRSSRGEGARQRHMEMLPDSKTSCIPSEETDKSNGHLTPNGFRSLKPGDASSDDFNTSYDKSREASQHGIMKRQYLSGVPKREL